MRSTYPLMSALLLWSVATSAQVPQNLLLSATAQNDPAREFVATWHAEFNLAHMVEAPETLILNLPDQTAISITKKYWEFRDGYFFADFDGDGNMEPGPDPEAAPEDISWLWYGTNEDWTVGLTLVKGVLAGTITSNGARYSISPKGDGVTEVGRSRPGYWSTHGDAREEMALQRDAKSGLPEQTSIAPTTWNYNCTDPLDTANHTIDVLVYYTDEMLVAYGNAAGVRSVVQGGIDLGNVALRNSLIYGMSYRLREIVYLSGSFDTDGIELAWNTFGGFTPSSSPPYCTFVTSTALLGRTTYGADLVMLARRATTPGDTSCGVASVQRKQGAAVVGACPYEPESTDFARVAFGVFDPGCGVNLNLAHELGHLLGMEHDPAASVTTTASITVFRPSCPWSYGHKNPAFSGNPANPPANYRFRTIMAEVEPIFGGNSGPPICSSGPPPVADETQRPQIPAYSPPDVEWNSGFLYGSATAAPEIGTLTPPSGNRKANASDTLPRLAAWVDTIGTPPDALFKACFAPNVGIVSCPDP